MNRTEHTAKPTRATGRFAALSNLFRANGTSAPLRHTARRTLSVFALAAFAAALLAPAAQAEPPKLITYGSFAAEDPFGVAVDQGTNDVYVAGLQESNLNKFDASGKRLPPSPFGEGSGLYSGAAVNPTNGDLYVVDAAAQAVQTYDPDSGAKLSEFGVPGSAGGLFGSLTWVQIATDAAGDVYLPNAPNNEVQEFDPAGAELQTFSGSGEHALSAPTGVAVDSSGNLWVADTGNGRIEEFDPAGTFLASIPSPGVQSVAHDATGHLFALVRNSEDSCGSLESPCYHLLEYASDGSKLADVGAGTIETSSLQANFGAIATLAVSESSGRVYVTDAGRNRIWIFGPPAAPTLGPELAVEISASEAMLGALVNPGGIDTFYRFEYGTTNAYGNTTPSPEGGAGAGVASRAVWAAAINLEPGTTYHYRVIATNELGKAVGPDQTFTTPSAAEASCPNEEFRHGFAATLPDCRAYELVTPATKTSTQPDPPFEFPRENNAARDGGRMSYYSLDSLPGSKTDGTSYLSSRGPTGWLSEDLIPLQSYTAFECPFHGISMPAYSADLSRGILRAGANQTPDNEFGGGCGAEEREIVAGEPQGVENLFLRDNRTATYQLIDVVPPGVTPANAHFDSGSSDLSHVVFDEHAKLTPEAPGGVDDLYEWSAGTVRLLTILPDGTAAVGSLATNGLAHEHAVSADGSRVLFAAAGNLYLRENADQPQSALLGEDCTEPTRACTLQVDASQLGGGGGGGQFRDASADGSRIFFTDDRKLTADSTAEAGQPDLYAYNLEARADQRLTDLTGGGSEPADVEGVSGVSEDGTYVYFAASADLASGAIQGRRNLYLLHGGTTTFIATLSQSLDGCDTQTCMRVSPNGNFLAFQSVESLTGYDNLTTDGNPAPEIFLYSAASNHLVCVSCIPSGEAPLEGAQISVRAGAAPHYLTDGGRVFFDTADALLPSDTNATSDVYEYQGGLVHLISTGTGAEPSVFLDASASGNDVFFLTTQDLLSQDSAAETRKIYDARVGGGFPIRSSPSPCTTAESCRPAPEPQPSISAPPSSATYSGPGNLSPRRRRACGHRMRRHRRPSCGGHRHRKQARRAHWRRKGQLR